jgi:putative transposase
LVTPLPFTNEVLNIMARCEAYSFLDGYSRYHQIPIVPKDIYKTTFVTDWKSFIWKVITFGLKNELPTV